MVNRAGDPEHLLLLSSGLKSAVDASGNVAATCTAGTTYTISLDNGLTGTGPTACRMTLAGNQVTYGLYKDAARLQPWSSSGPLHTARKQDHPPHDFLIGL